MLKERIEEVTQMNEQFYRAFENLDVGLMDSMWAHQEYVTCIHPGWSIRVGWPAVRDSWVVIFNNTFSMEFELTELQVQVAADIAWVICTENIASHLQVQVAADIAWVICTENIASRVGESPQNSKVVATNLFERIGDEWKIIHHHGSPLME